jgi:hypothetical protein
MQQAGNNPSWLNLKDKLDPRRFSGMSGLMAALVQHVLGEGWDGVEIAPEIVELSVTSDGFVLARHGGDIGFNSFIGSKSQLDFNFDLLAKAAELDAEEIAELRRLREARMRPCVSTRQRSSPLAN